MPPSKTTIRAPILPKNPEAVAITSLDDLEIEQCRVDACALANERGERVRLDGVRVTGGTLSETKLGYLTWLDVLCERCDLSMIDWPKAKLTRVELRDCRASGAKILEGEFDEVRFVDCNLEYASFSAARLRKVAFEQCRLKEADFNGADLSGASFTKCDLQSVDLTRAKLQGTDVSTSTLRDVRIGAGDVRGLIVNREQATALARLFGLVVRDE